MAERNNIVKYIFVFIFLSFSAIAEIDPNLIFAIAMTESSNCDHPNGSNDYGRAKGRYQIKKIYWTDGCKFLKVNWSWNDAYDQIRARKIVISYLEHYGRNYKKITGEDPSYEVFAKIHNGGPYGWRKSSTEEYWTKVKGHLPNGKSSKKTAIIK